MEIKIREYCDDDGVDCVTLSRELAEHHADIYNVPYIKLKDQAKWLDDLMQVELFQDLLPERGRKWKPGITIHGHDLDY